MLIVTRFAYAPAREGVTGELRALVAIEDLRAYRTEMQPRSSKNPHRQWHPIHRPLAYAAMSAEHRLSPPRPRPQTNGIVERFNGRISELLQQARFADAAELETTLQNYLKLYNHHIPQRPIDGKTPILALKEWQGKMADLFVKRVYEQAGLGNYSFLS